MKNPFTITLLCLSLIGSIATAQTKKPTTTTKKPSTTVKSTAPKTTTKTSTTTTTTIPNSSTAPVVVEEKKTTTTTTTSPTQNNPSSVNANSSTGSTTIQQSSGPSKGGRKPAETKPEKVKEPKPERVREPKPERVREPKPERVREPKPEKVKSPRSSSGDVGSHFGIKAGANSLFFLSSGKIQGGTPDFSVGFHGGLVGNFGLSETIAIQAEALYVQQSAKFSDGADNATFVGTGIEIPLALQFNFGGDTKFFINAGGYATYTLGGSQSGTTIPSVTYDYAGVSFGDRTDYGAIFGLGVKFNQALFIEARANYSIKDGSYTDAAGKKVVPIFAGLSLGYFF
jgi:Outer membrane protein beta-barrel domain